MEGAALFTSTLMGLYQNNQNRAASARMYNQQLYDQYVRDRALAVADLEAAKTTAEGIRTAGGVRNKGIYEAAATKAGEITEAADIEARGIMSSAATTFSEAMGNVEIWVEQEGEVITSTISETGTGEYVLLGLESGTYQLHASAGDDYEEYGENPEVEVEVVAGNRITADIVMTPAGK